MINGNVDVISIVETKIVASSPSAQFVFEGYYSPYRLYVGNRIGGILVYVKSTIPSHRISCKNFSYSIDSSSRPEVICKTCNFIKKETLAQVFSCEFCEISKNTFSYRTPPIAASSLSLFKINLRKAKWLVILIYCLSSQSSKYFLNNMTKPIDFFANKYDNYLIMGDFSMEPTDSSIKEFLGRNNLNNLIKSNICFKGKGSCIDLSLTNNKYAFKFSGSYETIVSDHHMI